MLTTQFFISLESRWTELFEDPLEPPVYLYQIKIHSELGSHWNSYVHKYAKRPRQCSNRSKAAVQVVDMATTIHMVPPTRASTFLITGTLVHYVFQYKLRWRPCWCSFGHLPWTKLEILYTTAAWVGCGIRLEPHVDGSTPIRRNDCKSYLQMCRIKGAPLISRYTAGQDWHVWTNLLLCTDSEVVLSNKLFDVSSFQLCNHDDAHIILHLHVTHSSSQYHDNW